MTKAEALELNTSSTVVHEGRAHVVLFNDGENIWVGRPVQITDVSGWWVRNRDVGDLQSVSDIIVGDALVSWQSGEEYVTITVGQERAYAIQAIEITDFSEWEAIR